MRRTLYLPSLFVFSSACAALPIGSYEVVESNETGTSCSGVDSERAVAFGERMQQGGAHVFEVGAGASGERAHIVRRDGTDLLIDLAPEGAEWVGQSLAVAQTVEAAGLGADFSALAEVGDIGCTLDVQVDLRFGYPEGDDVAMGTFSIEVRDASEGDRGCALERCATSFSLEAERTAAADPGIE